MTKRDNFQLNFSLKGYSSIQIGLYFLLAAFSIKKTLKGFLIDDNPMGMLSSEIIEILILAIIFLTIVLSALALFFKGRRKARKQEYKLWNSKTKNNFWRFLTSFVIIFSILIYLTTQDFADYITPTFLFLYGISLLFLKIKKSKNLFVLSGISILLTMICILIPNYWYSSIYILGIAHITYGLVVKN
jgi:magnesium-transporting ATPase (P-type)